MKTNKIKRILPNYIKSLRREFSAQVKDGIFKFFELVTQKPTNNVIFDSKTCFIYCDRDGWKFIYADKNNQINSGKLIDPSQKTLTSTSLSKIRFKRKFNAAIETRVVEISPLIVAEKPVAKEPLEPKLIESKSLSVTTEPPRPIDPPTIEKPNFLIEYFKVFQCDPMGRTDYHRRMLCNALQDQIVKKNVLTDLPLKLQMETVEQLLLEKTELPPSPSFLQTIDSLRSHSFVQSTSFSSLLPAQQEFSSNIPSGFTSVMDTSSVHNLIKSVQIYQAERVLNDSSIASLLNVRMQENPIVRSSNTQKPTELKAKNVSLEEINDLIIDCNTFLEDKQEKDKNELLTQRNKLEKARKELNTELLKMQNLVDAHEFFSKEIEIKPDLVNLNSEEIIKDHLSKISVDGDFEKLEFSKALIYQYQAKIYYLNSYILKLDKEITKQDEKEKERVKEELQKRVEARKLKQQEKQKEQEREEELKQNPVIGLPDGPGRVVQKAIDPYEVIVKLIYNVIRSKKYWKGKGSFLTGGRPRHINNIYLECQKYLEGPNPVQHKNGYRGILMEIILPRLSNKDQFDLTVKKGIGKDGSLLEPKASKFSHFGVPMVKSKDEQGTDSEEAMRVATDAMIKLGIISKLVISKDSSSQIAPESREVSQVSQRTISESRVSESDVENSPTVYSGLRRNSIFAQPKKDNSSEQKQQLQTMVQGSGGIDRELKNVGLQEYTLAEEAKNLEIYAQKRHRGVLEIGQKVGEVKELTQEVHDLVKEQQKGIDSIESNIGSAKEHVKEAVENLDEADKLQEKAIKKEQQVYQYAVDVGVQIVTGTITNTASKVVGEVSSFTM